MKNRYLVIQGKQYFTITVNNTNHTLELPCIFLIDRMPYTMRVFSYPYNNPKIPLIGSDGSVVHISINLTAKFQYARYISVAYAEKLRTENLEYVYRDDIIGVLRNYLYTDSISDNHITLVGADFDRNTFNVPDADIAAADHHKRQRQQSMGRVDRNGFRIKRKHR